MDNFSGAYQIASENYLETSSDLDLRARATCSLLLCNYEDAVEDFLTLNEIEKKLGRLYDVTYMNIALCYYAMGDNDTAIEYFKFPVINWKKMGTSDYSAPPAVLFYIGTKLNRQDVRKFAETELRRRKPEIPLFLLGKISEQELNKMVEQYPEGAYRDRQQCKVEFYKAVSQLQNGRTDKYLEHLNRCVELKGLYLEFEYYLAKVEFDRYKNIEF